MLGSAAYEALLASNHVLQSMDGRARWVDNVIVERWLGSLKSECVRICEYETPAESAGSSRATSSSTTAPARTSRWATTRRQSGTIRGWPPPKRRRYRTRAHFRPKISCPNKRATLMRASRNKAYDLIWSGEVDSYRLGRKLLVSRASVDAYIESRSGRK